MAFDPERLSLITQPVGDGGIRFFSYQTDDDSSTLTGAGHFASVEKWGVRPYDLIFVAPLTTGTPYLLTVDSVDASGNATATLGDDLTLPKEAATFLRRKADNSGYEARTPQQVVDELVDKTFTASDSNAAAVSVRSILERTLTPKMFGAVGDNSTDDTTALQRAINASAALRKPLRDDPDASGLIYRFTSTLSLPAYADVVLEKSQLHYAATTGNAVNVTGANWKFQPRAGLYSDALRTITGISKANPAVVTCTGHGFSTGNVVYIRNVAGMTEVNNKKFTITVINANSFSLDSTNSTSYTTYTSGGTAIRYVSGHCGIYGKLTVTSPSVVQTWIENIDYSGAKVWGFSESGIRLEWLRDFKFDDVETYDCGYAGQLYLSAVRGNSRRVVSHDIGPGSGGVAGYGMAFSRSWTSPALNTTEAPESQLINMGHVFCYNVPYYVGFDTHGGQGIAIAHLKTRNCHIGCNLEHATGGGSTVTTNDFTVASIDLQGVDPALHDVGPAIAIDGVSVGGSEISEGISVSNGTIRWHGYKNTFGNAVFNDAGAIWATNFKGLTLSNIQFRDCYARAIRLYDNGEGVTLTGLSCNDLVDVGGVQTMIQIGANIRGSADNLSMEGSAGTMLDVPFAFGAGYGFKAGYQLQGSSGITLMSANAAARLTYFTLDSNTWSPTATITLNADAASFSGCQYIRVGNRVTCWGLYTVDPTATGDTTVDCSLPIASAFTASSDAAGNFTFGLTGVTNSSGGVFANATDDRVTFRHNAASTASNVAYFTFGYLIK